MKILLINPPRTYYAGSKGVRVGLPLGLMYIAANLEKNNYTLKILDCLIHPKTQIINDREKTVHGLDWNLIKEIIRQESPDIVGITNPFTAQIENACQVAKIVKEINPKIITVMGGPHMTVRGQELLESNKEIDLAVIGEGEYTFLELVKATEKGSALMNIKNIIYRDLAGRVIQNDITEKIACLDNLPYPAYHLINMPLFFKMQEYGFGSRSSKHTRSISMITSRGCPYDCVFCSIHLHMGRLFRPHSADYIIDHINYVVKNFGVKHISFEDDNFTLDMSRAEKILNGLLSRHIQITWDTPNGVRADRLTVELAKLMKKSGCIELIFGVESGDQKILDKIINKNLRLETVIEAARICKEMKIKTRAFFVIGFPGEKIENMNKSTEFALMLKKRYGTESSFLIATPLLGTRLYDICRKNGYLIKEPDSYSLAIATQARGQGLIKTEDFNPEVLKIIVHNFEIKMNGIRRREKFFSLNFYFSFIRNSRKIWQRIEI